MSLILAGSISLDSTFNLPIRKTRAIRIMQIFSPKMRTNTHWNENLEEERPRNDDHEDILTFGKMALRIPSPEIITLPEKGHSDTLTGNEDKRLIQISSPEMRAIHSGFSYRK
jgi:hypothetical protein